MKYITSSLVLLLTSYNGKAKRNVFYFLYTYTYIITKQHEALKGYWALHIYTKNRKKQATKYGEGIRNLLKGESGQMRKVLLQILT